MLHPMRTRSRRSPIALLDHLEPRTLLSAGLLATQAAQVSAAPVVSIVKTRDANEKGSVAGTFTVKRSGGSLALPLTVNYAIDPVSTAVAGTNYTALAGSVVIPSGKASATIAVAVLQDGTADPTLTVVADLATGSGYTITPAVRQQSATLTITDSAPTVSISRTRDGSEVDGYGTGRGAFTITRRNGDLSQPLDVSYTVDSASTATSADVDASALPGTVTIPAGKASATFSVPVLAQANAPAVKTLELDLAAGSAYRLDPVAAHTSAAIKVKQVLSVDFATLLGFNAPGNSWNYNVTASHGVTGTASAQITDNGDGSFNWSDDLTPSSSNVRPVNTTLTWLPGPDGVRLSTVQETTAGLNVTIQFDNLLGAPQFLNGKFTGTSPLTIEISGVSASLLGVGSSVTNIGAPTQISVPAGTFTAIPVTFTFSYAASGSLDTTNDTANVSFRGTDVNTFYAVAGVGIIKYVSNASESASVSGHGSQSVSLSSTSLLTGYSYVPAA